MVCLGLVVEVVGVEALMLAAVFLREIGVRPVESDLETAPVRCRTGVLVPAGGAVLGFIFASLCVLVMGEALFGVGVLGVGVLGDMPTVL